MKPLTAILAALSLLAAGSASAQGATETDNRTGWESRNERSTDRSTKGSATAELSTLLTSGLRAVQPLTEQYMRRVYRRGWTLQTVTEERVGSDLAAYAAMRIQQLASSPDPVAQWAAQYLASCSSADCVQRFADRETAGLVVQSAHAAHSPGFAETELAGWRTILTGEFSKAWVPAVTYGANLANKVESALGRMTAGSTMSLAARRLALTKAFFGLPDDAVSLPTVEFSYSLANGQPGSPITLIYADGRAIKADEQGLHILAQGGQIFGNGYADGVRLSYSDEATAAAKSSHARTKGSTTTGKTVDYYDGPIRPR